MKIAARQKLRRAGLSAAAAAALLTTAGCAYINPPATTMVYSAADGIVEQVGDVKLANVLIVATGADQEGSVLGTLVNDGDQDVTLSPRRRARATSGAGRAAPAREARTAPRRGPG